MAKCVKPLTHLERLSAKSSRSTNQNAPFGRLSTTCCNSVKVVKRLSYQRNENGCERGKSARPYRGVPVRHNAPRRGPGILRGDPLRASEAPDRLLIKQ